MASIYKPKPTAKKWRIAYIDENGQRKTTGGFRDKQATLAKAAKLERNAERARAGLPVANEDRLRQPIQELIELWTAELTRLGRSKIHDKEQKRLLTILSNKCSWPTLSSIRIDKLTQFLSSLAGKSPRTLSAYRDALATFLGFAVQQRWIEDNPLRNYPKAKSGGRRTKPRRAYTIKEFRALIATKPHGVLYFVAGLSGLRKSELARLEKRDATPDGKKPQWHLRPEITKGRRLDIVPMLPELTPTLSAIWQRLAPTEKVFGTIPGTRKVHADLRAAKIKRLDDQGRCVDFHSLRYFFCTMLAKILPIQKVKILMRHKSIKQTADLYKDLGLEDVGEEVWSLPKFLGPGATTQSQPNHEEE